MNENIVKYPARPLLKKTAKVKSLTGEVKSLVDKMTEQMFKTGGVGLSANQIGSNLRIFVASPHSERNDLFVFINPRIISKKGAQVDEEGCLSVAGVSAFVRRYEEVEVEALNIEGKRFRLKACGLMARIIQHEIDHLNGKIFLNRLKMFERRKYLKKIKNIK
ncbi:MAG TPA: peptide deformylase [Candidatus Omnitrophica bacterium]|nr:peptide deformylase [Candidatus Omnitrophota bacterium]